MDCVGEVGFGARVWFESTRLGLARGVDCGAREELARGCGLFRRGWAWCAAVDCGGRGWVWRAAVDCGGEVGFGARL